MRSKWSQGLNVVTEEMPQATQALAGKSSPVTAVSERGHGHLGATGPCSAFVSLRKGLLGVSSPWDSSWLGRWKISSPSLPRPPGPSAAPGSSGGCPDKSLFCGHLHKARLPQCPFSSEDVKGTLPLGDMVVWVDVIPSVGLSCPADGAWSGQGASGR